MNTTDEELVQNTILGIKGSFDELVHRYTTLIYNFAYRLTGDISYAEDITQETFIKVWKNIHKYNSGYTFKTWIFTIARNTATDFLRKRKLILFSNLDTPDDNTSFESNIEDKEALPEESLIKLEDAEYLNKVLEQLPKNYQSVLVLHYQNDLTFEEIGKIMDKPPNTVKSWHRRSLMKLREILE
ncbi:MAG: RNA polymerase sigma factor [Patescibacteria group bacterium]|nr:RNA polymerase sigma factor [Patescibacteria group bacterium]